MTENKPKSEFRIELRNRLSELTSNQREERSLRIRDRILRSRIWKQSRGILFFGGRHDEPDLWPLLQHHTERGGFACLLSYSAGSDSYHARKVVDASRDLISGAYGILEPKGSCELVEWKHLDLVFVPGLGFDRSGTRLGRGRGYYDRLLPLMSACRCGIAFDMQIYEELPRDGHDVSMNMVVTENAWILGGES